MNQRSVKKKQKEKKKTRIENRHNKHREWRLKPHPCVNKWINIFSKTKNNFRWLYYTLSICYIRRHDKGHFMLKLKICKSTLYLYRMYDVAWRECDDLIFSITLWRIVECKIFNQRTLHMLVKSQESKQQLTWKKLPLFQWYFMV